MARTDFRSVDDYIAAQPPESQAVLHAVRRLVRQVLPDAVETISYQIPAYRTQSGPVIYFASWKRHWSLYPAPKDVREKLGDRLSAYEIEKGTIRFPLDAAIPEALVREIVSLRAAEVAEAGAA